MYDPRLSRFIQTDPLATNRPSEHFIYASNNPVSRTDPSGLQDQVERWTGSVAVIVVLQYGSSLKANANAPPHKELATDKDLMDVARTYQRSKDWKKAHGNPSTVVVVPISDVGTANRNGKTTLTFERLKQEMEMVVPRGTTSEGLTGVTILGHGARADKTPLGMLWPYKEGQQEKARLAQGKPEYRGLADALNAGPRYLYPK
ncbi:MAG: RHS repeat-associated core domain-containing protein, partial [candidate division WOR-3 bacterium]